MKQLIIILCVFSVAIIGCNQSNTKKQSETINNPLHIKDTVIIKQKNILDKSYLVDIYSKSYSYYWLVDNDTLDFTLNAKEYKNDTMLHLRAFHKKQIPFTSVLEKIEESLALIEEDFTLSKLVSIHFQELIFYFDLAYKLTNEYEMEFGQENIDQEQLNQFLLKSDFTSQLNHFLIPLNKKVKHYGFEKFHIVNKTNYKTYYPEIELLEYPEFTFNAYTGMYVSFENK